MGKRMRLVSTNSKQKRSHKRGNFLEDRISQLPDELLVSILSFLTLKETAMTSALSRRWERLWTFFTGSLHFDVTKSLIDVPDELFDQERSKYISHVNQVLASLNGSPTLEEFGLLFDSDEDSKCHIDKWVESAIKKRVKRLQLDMLPFDCDCIDNFVPYTFPLEFYARIKQPSGLHRISTLTSLCLKFVKASEEFIECFLFECPLVEKLCVVASKQLLNLKVTGAALRLKYLEMSQCSRLINVEISAPNLVSLNYFSLGETKLHVKNVPKLIEVSIGREVITYMSCSLSSYLSQLETLKLDIDIMVHEEFMHSVELSNLKHLLLRANSAFTRSLLGWTSLIEASPFLHKFTLEVSPLSTYKIS